MKSKSYYLPTETINLIKAVSLSENKSLSKVVDTAIKNYVTDKHKAIACLLQEESK